MLDLFRSTTLADRRDLANVGSGKRAVGAASWARSALSFDFGLNADLSLINVLPVTTASGASCPFETRLTNVGSPPYPAIRLTRSCQPLTTGNEPFIGDAQAGSSRP